MRRMRQWYVDDRAIPPDMNARFNRCRDCHREWKRTRRQDATCPHHYQELQNYARSRPKPPPEMKRGAVRVNCTAHVRE